MPKRRSSRILVYLRQAPETMASGVVDKYVVSARKDLASWSRSYTSTIEKYLGDVDRQKRAKDFLATWYNVFITEIYPQLTDIYSKGKTAYMEKKRAMLTAGTARPPV